MNCHYCGAPLHDNDIFCRNCGTRQLRDAQMQPEAVAEAEKLDSIYLAPTIEVAAAQINAYKGFAKRNTTFYTHLISN